MNSTRRTSYIFSLYILLSAFHVQHIAGDKVSLEKKMCDKYLAQTVKENADVPGWSSGNDKKTCHICNPTNTRKSWLVTQHIPTQEYNFIHVDVRAVKTDCKECQNQDIKVFILHGNSHDDSPEEKLINIFQKLPLLKTLYLSKANKTNDWYHFQIETNASTFSLLFLSEGSCTIIYEIESSSFVCEKTSSEGLTLLRTVSPGYGDKKVNVSCPYNSRNLENYEPSAFCSSEGKWKVNSSCRCIRGYTLADEGGCEECKINTYKDIIGNVDCADCPDNSKSASGKLECQCEDGFYRFKKENHTRPCYGVPSAVTNTKFRDKTQTSVTFQWQRPAKRGTSDQKVLYKIKCSKCQSNSQSGPCIEPCTSVKFKPSNDNLVYTNVTIENLQQDTEYEFAIYSKNENSHRINETNWSKVVKKIRTEGLPTSDSLPAAVVIGIPIIVVIMMVIIIILVVCLLKRRKEKQFRRSLRIRGTGIPLVPGEKNYIDPTTYDNPERAVLEFTKELDRNLIKFEAIIGGGEFGDVYKGEIKLPGHPATKVAIKTLKSGAKHKNRTDFLIEASVMGQFKDLNVITLEGVVTKTVPLLIVIEFMENGSLDKYLKNNDGMLKPLQLLGMARGVASGMDYLAGMHFIHRDLAARNVLVNANLACKVADFGLSRDIGQNEDSEYQTQGGKIPVRWTAPEAIRYRKFSTASDIWSYGILLWEIMSFAERPYWNWGNEEVMKRVDEQGYRLPPPMNCPKIVHQLMKECWLTDRTKRPPFKEIVRILDEWIKYPEKLNEDYIKVRRTEPLDYSSFTSVKDWLDAIKMGMYATNFTKAGYEELSDVAELTEDELLKKVGVRLVGHRHKIYQRIQEMSDEMNLKREQSHSTFRQNKDETKLK